MHDEDSTLKDQLEYLVSGYLRDRYPLYHHTSINTTPSITYHSLLIPMIPMILIIPIPIIHMPFTKLCNTTRSTRHITTDHMLCHTPSNNLVLIQLTHRTYLTPPSHSPALSRALSLSLKNNDEEHVSQHVPYVTGSVAVPLVYLLRVIDERE